MGSFLKELKYQLRHRLPMWLVGLLTNWWPDNRLTIKVKCGRNFTVSQNATFANPHNIEIGNNVYIATGAWLNGLGGLVVEDEVEISPYVVGNRHMHSHFQG